MTKSKRTLEPLYSKLYFFTFVVLNFDIFKIAATKKEKDKKHKNDKKKKENVEEKESKNKTKSEETTSTTTINCDEHPNEALTMYCLSCQQCICNICYEKGRHSRVNHISKNLKQMYQEYGYELKTMIDSSIIPQKECVENQINKITQMIHQLQANRLRIELTTHREFDGIMGRLKDEENKKLSILHANLENLRQILKDIHNLVQAANQVQSDSDSFAMIHLLKNYPHYHQTVSILSNKIITKSYDVDVSDFPEEVEARREMLANYNSLLFKTEIKDKFIDFLLSERKRLSNVINKQNKNFSDLENISQQEIKRWMELTDKFAQSLKAFKLKCAYCNVPISQSSVNSFCEMNTDKIILKHEESDSEERIDLNETQNNFGLKGSSLHYFIPFS
ncbi:hypothetical protein RFI_23466 [Reticulomyxa filosa]|uniref:B box-type domain-containing protein n=1 Tax=Reticulomyxa filosa TaxID=46433 RepID=X6MJU9_RETFI|nr:hypothetical protein RFI_23466 [Reticulomyxa filosa]|eukprot:ETO13901.1 hypothetical protein RFI_23466 [Reticulomyxa filosa]